MKLLIRGLLPFLFFTLTLCNDPEVAHNRVDFQNLCNPCSYPPVFQNPSTNGQPKWMIGGPNTMGHTSQPQPFPNQQHNPNSASGGMQPIHPMEFQGQPPNNTIQRQQPVDNTQITQGMVEKLKESVNEAENNDEKQLIQDVLKIYEGSPGNRGQKWNEVVTMVEASRLPVDEKQRVYQIVANATSV